MFISYIFLFIYFSIELVFGLLEYIIFILLYFKKTAFLGYVLPWGMMLVFGELTVITNFIFNYSFYWYIKLLYGLWGSFALGQNTLTEIF